MKLHDDRASLDAIIRKTSESIVEKDYYVSMILQETASKTAKGDRQNG